MSRENDKNAITVVENAVSVMDQNGGFVTSLKRNNKKIREDRALAIAEDTYLFYKRKVEDLETYIRKMRREQDYMLDLSPHDATSLILAADFNAEDFVKKDLELGVKIKNAEIKLEVAKERFVFLFGGVE